MDVEKLKAFYYVAKTKSFTKASMVIVTPNTDNCIEKFKDKTSLGLDDIESENIIFTEEKSSLMSYFDTSIIEKEISFDSFLEFGNVESTKKLVKYGFGITILLFL